MTAQDGVTAAERIQRLDRDEAFVSKYGVEGETTGPLAQDHAVAVRPVRLGGAVAKDVIVQHTQNFDERHGRTDVSALPSGKPPYDQTAQMFRPFIELRPSRQTTPVDRGAHPIGRSFHVIENASEK